MIDLCVNFVISEISFARLHGFSFSSKWPPDLCNCESCVIALEPWMVLCLFPPVSLLFCNCTFSLQP